MSATALQPASTFAIEEVETLLGRAEDPLVALILAAIAASKARGISLADWVTAVDQRPAQWQMHERLGEGAMRVADYDTRAPYPHAPPAALHHGGPRAEPSSNNRLTHAAIDPFLDIYAPIAAQLVGL